jgi:hypothetical protein
MPSFQPHHESDNANTIAALGLRWAALRGMLASPLINADDQKPLREELLQEIQTIGQTMSGVAARNPIELCAKIDVMSEELRKAVPDDGHSAQTLLASIRNDVMALSPRAVSERSNVQLVRGVASHRSVEAVSAEAVRGEAAKGL